MDSIMLIVVVALWVLSSYYGVDPLKLDVDMKFYLFLGYVAGLLSKFSIRVIIILFLFANSISFVSSIGL